MWLKFRMGPLHLYLLMTSVYIFVINTVVVGLCLIDFQVIVIVILLLEKDKNTRLGMLEYLFYVQ
jgi:hypothetical protein